MIAATVIVLLGAVILGGFVIADIHASLKKANAPSQSPEPPVATPAPVEQPEEPVAKQQAVKTPLSKKNGHSNS